MSNTHGSLARVLTPIAEAGINLSKLQSFPVPGGEWKYFFHADMEFATTDQFENTLEMIRPITEKLRVLGVYHQGKTV